MKKFIILFLIVVFFLILIGFINIRETNNFLNRPSIADQY